MKKLHLLGTVCALTFFAMNSSALAAIVVSDDTSIASTGQSYAQTQASSFSASAPTLDVHGDSGQTEPYKIFGYSMDSTLPVARPHADSHLSLWLLLIVAAVFGVISEVFHRRSVNR